MVFSIKINYDGLNFTDRSKLRYAVFGRIVTSGVYTYYYPGILDDVRYSKIGRNLIIIEKPVTLPVNFKDRIIFNTLPSRFEFKTSKTGKQRLLEGCKVLGTKICNVTKQEMYSL